MTTTDHQESAKDDTSSRLSAAMEHHQRGELDAAAQAYRQVLDANPDHFDALHYLGVLRYQQNQPEHALPLLEKAISLNPEDAGCRSNLGLVHLAMGDITQAMKLFRTALRIDPKFTDAHNNLGNAFMRNGQIAEAISAYRSALSQDDTQPSVHNNLGVALKRQGLLEEAMAEYLKALKLSPGFADAGANLGDVLFQLKRYDDAIRCYRQVCQLTPRDSQAWAHLGDVYKETEQWNEARQAYQQALSLNDKLISAVINLGVVAQQTKTYDEASASYRRALEIDPNCAVAHNNLGTVLRENGDTAAAIGEFQNALRISPDYMEARYNLAMTIQAQGDLVGALGEYMAMIESDPKDGRGYYGAVKVLDLLERYDELAELTKKWQSSGADIQLDGHLQAALTGQLPERAADDYVKDQFDGLADEFENKLAALEYRAPQLIVEALAPILQDHENELAILDAGCGTGLCGTLMRPYAKRLTGVDLSPGMLNKAREKGIYDDLVEKELTEYFRHNENRYDVIVCVDTLVYFGQLTEVLKGMHTALADGGTLAFTVEKSDNSTDFKLEHTGRYTHSFEYLTDQLQQAGFGTPKISEVKLRTERFRPVAGWLVVVHPGRNNS